MGSLGPAFGGTSYVDGYGDYHDIATRHGFLAALHDVLKPRVYLEIGVQHGYSYQLAHAAAVAIGIDPQPLINPVGNQGLFRITSDEFFRDIWTNPALHDTDPIDFAFIDGYHEAGQAMRDFANVERFCRYGSVVAFDDVLPRNAHEARHIPVGDPVLGDWTGDVWKVHPILRRLRPDLTLRLVDVQPTGLLIVTGFNQQLMNPSEAQWLVSEMGDMSPDPEIYSRAGTLTPLVALQQIRQERAEVTE